MGGGRLAAAGAAASAGQSMRRNGRIVAMRSILADPPAGVRGLPRLIALPHRRNDERILARHRAIRPALGDLLVLGPEADALLTMLVDVAEAGALPAAERVIGDGDRDRHVDADHADIDPGRELAGGVAVAGEDGDAIAIFMVGGEAQSLLEAVRADHLQDRTENLLLVGAEARLHMVEEGRTDEETLLMALQREA